MKKLLYFAFFSIFAFFGTVFAENVSIDWMIDDNVYTSTTCNMGGDLILPQTPSKPGYTFMGWKTAAYTPIEYLLLPGGNNDSTRYIDTGIIANETTVSRLKLQMYQATGGIIYGNINDNNAAEMYRFFNYNQRFFFLIGTTALQGVYNIGEFKNYETYDFLIGMQYVKDYETDSIIVGSPRGVSTYNPTTTLKIYNNAPGRIYLLQIWNNNVLVRDMIPVIDYNGVVCLFDKLESKFYYYNGQEQITAGPIVEEYR